MTESKIEGPPPVIAEIKNLRMSTIEDLVGICKTIISIGLAGLSEGFNYNQSDFEVISSLYENFNANVHEALEKGLFSIKDLCMINSAMSSVVALAATNDNYRALISKAKLLQHMIPFMGTLYDLVNSSGISEDLRREIGDGYIMQTYRAIGNSCFDHDGNCKTVEQIPGAMDIMVKCATGAKGELLTYHVGCLMNIIIQSGKLLEDLAARDYYHTYIGIIDSLCLDTEESIKSTGRGATFALTIILTIQELSSVKYPIQPLLKKIYEVISKLNTHMSALIEENKLPDAIEIDCLKAALSVVDCSSQDEEYHINSFELGGIRHIINVTETYKRLPKAQSEIRKRYAACVNLAASIMNGIASCNTIMERIETNQTLLETIHFWIRHSLDSQDTNKTADSISALGLYCLGNLCRNNKSNEYVIQHKDVIESVFEILTKSLEESKALFSEASGDLPSNSSFLVSEIAKSTPLSTPESLNLSKAVHAAVGILGNLSINESEAKLFGEMGLIHILLNVLDDNRFLFMRHEVIILMRHISSQDPDIISILLTGSKRELKENAQSSMSLLGGSPIDIITRKAVTDSKDSDIPFRNEVARLCAKLVRNLCATKDSTTLKSLAHCGNFLSSLVQAITGISIDSCISLSDKSFKSVPRTFNTHHGPLQIYKTVQAECLFSLIALTRDHVEYIMPYYPVLVKTLSDVLLTNDTGDRSELQIQFKINASILLKELIDKYKITSSEAPDNLVDYLKSKCCVDTPLEKKGQATPESYLTDMFRSVLTSLEKHY